MQIEIEEIRKFWDFYQTQSKDIVNFDTFLVHYFPSHFWGPHQRRVELILEGGLSEPILEAGSGSGWLTFLLSRKGLKTVGIDLLEKQLFQSTLLFKRFHLEGNWVQGNLLSLPFPDASFASMIALDILEHIKDIDQTLRELRRVIKDKGTFYVTVPNGWGAYCILEDRLHKKINLPLRRFIKKIFLREKIDHKREGVERYHEHLHGLGWWKKQFRTHGFEVVKTNNLEFISTVIFPRIGYQKCALWSQRDCWLAQRLPSVLVSEWLFQLTPV